jgi:chromosome segregation ATPase
MENLIKKNFKLSSEKLLAFTESNPVQITLREELEAVYKAKNQLEEENQSLKLSLIANRENDSKNLIELNQTLEKLKNEVQVLSLRNQDKEMTIKNLNSVSIKLKHELKTADDERNRLKTWYIPRLKETRKYQKELYMELDKIRSDAELLPSMFRAEAMFRN